MLNILKAIQFSVYKMFSPCLDVFSTFKVNVYDFARCGGSLGFCRQEVKMAFSHFS